MDSFFGIIDYFNMAFTTLSLFLYPNIRIIFRGFR